MRLMLLSNRIAARQHSEIRSVCCAQQIMFAYLRCVPAFTGDDNLYCDTLLYIVLEQTNYKFEFSSCPVILVVIQPSAT